MSDLKELKSELDRAGIVVPVDPNAGSRALEGAVLAGKISQYEAWKRLTTGAKRGATGGAFIIRNGRSAWLPTFD